MSELSLEEKFKLAVEKSKEEINEHLKEAEKALGKAIKLSEKYGVPFDTDISFITQSYRPDSFDEKWEGLDIEKLYNEDDICIPEYCGWEHSAVC